jgi:hydroxymethylpyrimidine/phosphomethylpyrimidine kinase
MTNVPVALTIAGSDSSAGAGIQADLKTFAALGVYGLTSVTCIVAETPGKVASIEPVSAEMVRAQVEVVARAFPIRAIKTGLLCNAEIVATVAKAIVDLARDVPVVIDPVMIATSGDPLLPPEAIEVYERELFPRAKLITPNLDEASKLLGESVQDRQSMERAVCALSKRYGTNILLKGGHLPGDVAIDLLCAGENVREFAAPFVRRVTTHGTGCTYSAAITASLARGESLETSILHAKEFVSRVIRDHFAWGEVHALNHFAPDANA